MQLSRLVKNTFQTIFREFQMSSSAPSFFFRSNFGFGFGDVLRPVDGTIRQPPRPSGGDEVVVGTRSRKERELRAVGSSATTASIPCRLEASCRCGSPKNRGLATNKAASSSVKPSNAIWVLTLNHESQGSSWGSATGAQRRAPRMWRATYARSVRSRAPRWIPPPRDPFGVVGSTDSGAIGPEDPVGDWWGLVGTGEPTRTNDAEREGRTTP